MPDGKLYVFIGNEKDRGLRLWVHSVDSAKPTPITPEGVRATQWVISPDGNEVAAVLSDRKGYLFPVAGGDPKPIAGFPEGFIPVSWSGDGKSIFMYNAGDLPAKVDRLNLATGQRQAWKTLMPPDVAGVTDVGPTSSRPTPAPTSTNTDALSPTSTWCKASFNNQQRSVRTSLRNAAGCPISRALCEKWVTTAAEGDPVFLFAKTVGISAVGEQKSQPCLSKNRTNKSRSP